MYVIKLDRREPLTQWLRINGRHIARPASYDFDNEPWLPVCAIGSGPGAYGVICLDQDAVDDQAGGAWAEVPYHKLIGVCATLPEAGDIWGE